MEQILDFQLESLGTIVGIAVVVKYILVPITKSLWETISGRATTIVAIACGLLLSVGFRAVIAWPIAGREAFEAVMFGIIGGWAAIGLQDLVTAALRPEKL